MPRSCRVTTPPVFRLMDLRERMGRHFAADGVICEAEAALLQEANETQAAVDLADASLHAVLTGLGERGIAAPWFGQVLRQYQRGGLTLTLLQGGKDDEPPPAMQRKAA